MKIKFKINNQKLIINLEFLYELNINYRINKNLIYLVNQIIKQNNIVFLGNKILIYVDSLFIGTLYLTTFYLKKTDYYNKNNILTSNNCYFEQTNIIEIYPHNKWIKSSPILSY